MKPEKEFRSGAVSAAIWMNERDVEGETVSVATIQIQKTYKDGDDWKRTNSFTTEDLPRLVLVASEAYRHLSLRSREPGE